MQFLRECASPVAFEPIIIAETSADAGDRLPDRLTVLAMFEGHAARHHEALGEVKADSGLDTQPSSEIIQRPSRKRT
jgi:hypothetical protein